MSNDRQLWRQLQVAGLVGREQLQPAESQPAYLRMFFGGMAWLAAQSFLLAVILMLGIILKAYGLDGIERPLVLAGSILLIGAGALVFRKERHFFLKQTGVAAVLTGQGLLLLYLMLHERFDLAWLVWLQVPVFFLVRESMLRSLSVLVFVLAGSHVLAGFATAHELQALLVQPLLPLLVLCAAWLYAAPALLARWYAWLYPLRHGLTLALWSWLLLQQTPEIIRELYWLQVFQPALVLPVVAGFLFWLLSRIPEPATRLYGLVLGLLVLLAGWQIPAVAPLALLLALAWMQGERRYWVGHLLGLVATLVFYYYSLQQTLLVKSYILLGLAVLLLLLRFWLQRLPAAGPGRLAGQGGVEV